jgi:hypothetical protein
MGCPFFGAGGWGCWLRRGWSDTARAFCQREVDQVGHGVAVQEYETTSCLGMPPSALRYGFSLHDIAFELRSLHKRERGISSLAAPLERDCRMRRFRAVAWDVDGTLVDSEPLHHRALLAAGGRSAVDRSDHRFRGIHMCDVWTTMRRRMPGGLAQVEWLARSAPPTSTTAEA